MLIRIIVIIEIVLDVIFVFLIFFVCKSGIINFLISDYMVVFVEFKVKVLIFFLYYILVCSYKNYSLIMFFGDLVVNFICLLFIFDIIDVNV